MCAGVDGGTTARFLLPAVQETNQNIIQPNDDL